MAQTVTVTLTTADINTGPFTVYGVDSIGNLTQIATGVSRANMLAGQTYSNVPATSVSIKVESAGVCTNSITIPIT